MYHTYRRRFALHYFIQINDKSEPIPYRKKVRIILIWWSMGGSNPRPQDCEPCALPAELMPREKPRKNGLSILHFSTILSKIKYEDVILRR